MTTETTTGRTDYQVCNQCRTRKIRCDRERPQCSNCVRFGYDCEWSGSGKKKNQTVVLIKTVSDLRNRLDHLVDAVSKIEGSLQSLRSQANSQQSSQIQSGVTTPQQQQQPQQQPLAMPGWDFNARNSRPVSNQSMYPHTAPSSSHGGSTPNPGNATLPPHIAAAVQLLATYVQTDTDGRQRARHHSNSSLSSSASNFAQQNPLQALHHLSSFEQGNNALNALFSQPGNMATVSAFANAMYNTSGPPTPMSQHDQEPFYDHSIPTTSSQGFSPASLAYVQDAMLQHPGDAGFFGQAAANGSPESSENSEDFIARHHAFFAAMQDPASTCQPQHGSSEDHEFTDANHVPIFSEPR